MKKETMAVMAAYKEVIPNDGYDYIREALGRGSISGMSKGDYGKSLKLGRRAKTRRTSR